MTERSAFSTTSNQSAVVLSTPKPCLPKGYWNNAIINFRGHIDDLVNPFVVRDMIGALKKINEGLFDPDKGILSYFEELILPLETRDAITQFDSAIENLLNHDFTNNTVEEVTNEIKQIYQHLSHSNEIKERKCWEDLSMLYQLGEVKKLENTSMKKFLAFVYDGEQDKAEEFLRAELKKAHKDSKICEILDEKLDKIDGIDLYTLISEIIEKQPKVKKEGLQTYWSRSTEFFEGKTLYLKDTKKAIYRNGRIAKCEKTSDRIIFHLHDDSRIIATNREKVEIIEVTKSNLWSSIHRDEVKKGGIVQIQSDDRMGLVPTGSYQVVFEPLKAPQKDLIRSIFNWLSKKEQQTVEGQLKNQFNITLTNKKNKKMYRFFVFGKQDVSRFARKKVFFRSHGEQDPKEVSLSQLNDVYLAKETTILTKIGQTTLEESVKIRDVKDENLLKLKYLKNLEKEKEKIRVELIEKHEDVLDVLLDSLVKNDLEKIDASIMNKSGSEEVELIEKHEDVLDVLLDSLVENDLEKIDASIMNKSGSEEVELIKMRAEEVELIEKRASIMNKSGLHPRLKALSEKYESYLGIQTSPEEILKNLAIQANYQKVISKKKYLEIASTMSLLRDAMESVEKIDQKEVSFFIGNTGAGKSTAIGFLLGANLEEFENPVGDKVLRYKFRKNQNPEDFPVIGQSLGQSETLYTTGYVPQASRALKNPERFGIGDCPGFHNTRGTDYELCANLSIDEAVNGVKSIRSVVVVTPAASFITDRANPILDLVDTVKDKFPFAFTTSNQTARANSRIFMLVTKSNHIPPESLSKLKDGTRFNLLMQEAQEKIKELSLSQAGKAGEHNYFRISSFVRKKEIWEALIRMLENKQIDFVNVKNRRQRGRLIKKYLSEGRESIAKSQYSKAMENGPMQRKFGKCVEMSVNTWEKIFRRFLNISQESERRIGEMIKREEITDRLYTEHLELKGFLERVYPEQLKNLSHELPKDANIMKKIELTEKRIRKATKLLGYTRAERMRLEKAIEKFEEYDLIMLKCNELPKEKFQGIKDANRMKKIELTEKRMRKATKLFAYRRPDRMLLEKDIEKFKREELAELKSCELPKEFQGIKDANIMKKIELAEKRIRKATKLFLGTRGERVRLEKDIEMFEKAELAKLKLISLNEKKLFLLAMEQNKEVESFLRYLEVQPLEGLCENWEIKKSSELEKKYDIVRLKERAETIIAKRKVVHFKERVKTFKERVKTFEPKEVSLSEDLATLKTRHFHLLRFLESLIRIKFEEALKNEKACFAINQKTVQKLQKEKKYLAIVVKTEWETGYLLKAFAEKIVRGTSIASGEETKSTTLRSCQTFLQVHNKLVDAVLKKCKNFTYINSTFPPLQALLFVDL